MPEGVPTGSGKQILSKILADLSTTMTPPEALPEATRRLRAGLLLHGSTASESFDHAGRLAWRSGIDGHSRVWRQGIATAETTCFLTDLFESMREMPGLQAFLRARHPGLTAAEYEASEWALWLIVSSVQMYTQLLEVERDATLDIDGRVEAYARHFRQHFLDRGIEPDCE